MASLVSVNKDLVAERYIRSLQPVLWCDLWKKDGKEFVGESAYGLKGTVTGAVWGLRGREFDGVDDNINFGNPACLQISKEITIETWLRHNPNWGNIAVGDESALGKREALNRGYRARFTSAQTAVFVLGDGVADHQITSPAFPIIPGFRHYIYTYNGMRMRLYMNGTQVAQSALDIFTIDSVQDNCYIGRTTASWNGTIGEVRIYNKGLSPLEASTLYNITEWRYR